MPIYLKYSKLPCMTAKKKKMPQKYHAGKIYRKLHMPFFFFLTCKEQISKEPKPKIICASPKQSDKVSKYFKVIGHTI